MGAGEPVVCGAGEGSCLGVAWPEPGKEEGLLPGPPNPSTIKPAGPGVGTVYFKIMHIPHHFHSKIFIELCGVFELRSAHKLNQF